MSVVEKYSLSLRCDSGLAPEHIATECCYSAEKRNAAIQLAEASGWVLRANGRVLCQACAAHEAGTQAGEVSRFIIVETSCGCTLIQLHNDRSRKSRFMNGTCRAFTKAINEIEARLAVLQEMRPDVARDSTVVIEYAGDEFKFPADTLKIVIPRKSKDA